jgi:hypothetical protein
MLATVDTALDTAYICITSPLYMYTLMGVIRQPTSMVIQNAINNILDNGLDPNIDVPFSNDITHLIIPLNLTGTHWIFVHVRNNEYTRIVDIYDTIQGGCQATKMQLHHVHQFLVLLSYYRLMFSGA